MTATPLRLCKQRPYRITPPPPPPVARRTFLTRRSTSFYTHSYPPVTYSAEIPYVPPTPEASSSNSPGDAVSTEAEQPIEGKRKERKERYLESLMDKAGELSLRCEWRVRRSPRRGIDEIGSILDSSGNWRAEEGRYKKTELCREHDLDVGGTDVVPRMANANHHSRVTFVNSTR